MSEKRSRMIRSRLAAIWLPLFGLLITVANGAEEQGDLFLLWTPDRPVPSQADIPQVPGVQLHQIKARTPDLDGYNWLHGVALAWRDDGLFASFGHNRGSENTASEEANARISRDGGATWGPLTLIDDGDAPDLAVSHGVFLSTKDALWAFQGAFFGRMRDVHTRGYRWDGPARTWRKLGRIAGDGFWPMQEPIRMDNGNYVMAGIVVENGYGGPDDPAAVAISHGDDLTRWNVVPIPKPGDMIMWGESTVLVDGPELVCIARYRQPTALAAISSDYGRTWSRIRRTNLPMAASKPYAGVLSNGSRYLIGNITADNGNARRPLTIALSRPGEKQFSQIFIIRDAVVDERSVESHPRASLAYPYAVQRGGLLCVGYSNDGSRGGNRNSAELAVIPVAGLIAPFQR